MKKNKTEEFINNPKKALFVLALPMMIGMIVQMFYNIVDTAFIGRLGAESIAAITFSFPLFFILISLGSGMNIGVGSLISRNLGADKKEEAENVAMHGLFISLIIASLILLFGKIFINPLFNLLGADGDVLKLAIGYMSIVFVSIFFMFLSFTIGGILSSQGNARSPMMVQVFSLVINIILDPIFIYYFDMGVGGAAVATLIAAVFGLLFSVYLLLNKSYLKIHLSSFNFSFDIVKNIFVVGFPASLMMLLISLFSIIANKFMAFFGTETVAAFGVVSRLESMYVMPMVSFSMAIVTLVAMFYGAKRFDLLRNIIWYGVKITIMISLGASFLFFLFPTIFVRIFTNDQELIRLSSYYLRFIVFSFPFVAITMPVSRALQGMGYGLPGLIINLVRMIIISIPLSYVLIFIFGYSYLSMAVAVIAGAIAATILAVTWLELKLRKLG